MMRPGDGGGRPGASTDPPDRPADRAARRRTRRRVVGLFRPYHRAIGGLVAMIVVSAGLGMIPPFLLRDLLDGVLGQGSELSTRRLDLLVAGMIVIPIIVGAIGVAQTWSSNRIGQDVMHDLRARVYAHLQRLSLAFFSRTRTGEVQSRIANDIGGVQNVVTSTATSIASNVTTVAATTVAMLLLDWRLALASFALVPFFVLLTRRVGRRRQRIAQVKQGSLADMSALVEESLSVSGVLLGKTMGRVGDLTERFRAESRRLAGLEVRQRMAGRWSMATIQMTFAIMPALVYGVAGHAMAMGQATISVGTLVAFTTLQVRLLSPVGSLLNVQVDVQTSLALFDRVFEYLDLPVDIDERPDAVELDPRKVRGEVGFRAVGFTYDPDAAPVLRDVDLLIPAGARVAVVGETGSGKTTLGYLVARLYDVTTGAVTIDGHDVRDLSFASLRSAVAVVSQETYLFHGSVRDNLRFGRPEASDAEVEAAARAARIHDLVAGLPDGYDTVVGERGYRFSGGERQRMALARALLRDAPVLILDEATSALDVDTERQVHEALRSLGGERTTIAIAHRLSTVRDADLIVVLDGGRIEERGTHAELVARGGRYAALVASDHDRLGAAA